MKMIDFNLLKGKIVAMQTTEPEYAFNFLNNAQNPSTEWGCIDDMLDSMEVYVAEPVKHGRWFHINNDGIVYCSECNNEAYWDTDYGQQLFDYCPYCGAKMIKDGDKE